ncbi:hypothetical protein HK101_011001 [Irineochytrium annulatum]|nr:hypothetical protein HK101_011001 [Irineochytrium annulatum]
MATAAAHIDNVESLQTELHNLTDYNAALLRDLNELKRERLQWKETQKLAAELESVATRLQQDVAATQAENARLRRQNEDLEKRLEREMTEGAESRQRWMEKEEHLMASLRADRNKLKELRALNSQKDDSSYDEEEEVPKSRDPSPVPRTEATAIVEENMKLDSKDLLARKQEQDILELQRTVSALMDEIEAGYETAQFEYGAGETAHAGGGSVPPSPPTSASVVTFSPGTRTRSGSVASSNNSEDGLREAGRTLAPMKSFNSLADELNQLGVKVPDVTSTPSLKARLAGAGLSTEGNRQVLKKRLQRFIAKKKKQAEPKGEARAAAVEAKA